MTAVSLVGGRGTQTALAGRAAKVRIIVGERPALLLESLMGVLARAGLEVCAGCTTPESLETKVAREAVDVVLVDAGLGSDGEPPLRFLARVRRAAPGARIVVLVDELTPALAHAAMEQEVDGVVLGSASADDVAHALEQVAAGYAVFPTGWLGTIHRAEHQSLFAQLSGRQLQVLELLARGLENQQIAERLHISRNTVKFHVRIIYERLSVTNRVQAAALLAQAVGGQPVQQPVPALSAT